MNEAMKAQALAEIRRREEAATGRDWVRLRLVERMIETELSMEAVGQIVDERGDTWDYAIALKSALAEGVRDGLPMMQITRHSGRDDLFGHCFNRVCDLDDRIKKIGRG